MAAEGQESDSRNDNDRRPESSFRTALSDHAVRGNGQCHGCPPAPVADWALLRNAPVLVSRCARRNDVQRYSAAPPAAASRGCSPSAFCLASRSSPVSWSTTLIDNRTLPRSSKPSSLTFT